MTAHKNHEHFNTYTCYLHQPIYIPFGYSSSGMKPTSLQPSRPPAHNNGHGPKLTSVQILEKPDIPRFDPNVHAHNTLFLTTRDMEVSTFFFFLGPQPRELGLMRDSSYTERSLLKYREDLGSQVRNKVSKQLGYPLFSWKFHLNGCSLPVLAKLTSVRITSTLVASKL